MGCEQWSEPNGFMLVCERCGFTLGPTPTIGATLPPCIHCGGPVQAILRPVQPESEQPTELPRELPIHRTEAGYPRCATCDGGGCLDCTDPA